MEDKCVFGAVWWTVGAIGVGSGAKKRHGMKKKSLDEVMMEYAASRRDDERTRSLALFLAYRDDIRELHRNGWNYADIWRAMRGAGIIPFSYSSFRRYARKFCGMPPASLEPQPPSSDAPAQSAGTAVLPSWPKPGQSGGKPIAPGSTRVDMPVFGKNHKPRDPNSF